MLGFASLGQTSLSQLPGPPAPPVAEPEVLPTRVRIRWAIEPFFAYQW